MKMINKLSDMITALNSDKPLSVVRLGNIEATQMLYKLPVYPKMKTNAGWYGKPEKMKDWKSLMFSALLNADLNLRVVSCESFFICDDVLTNLKLFIPTLPYSEDIRFWINLINSIKTNNIGIVSHFTKDMERQSKRINYVFPVNKENGHYLGHNLTDWKYIKSENTIEGNEPEGEWIETFNDLKERTLKADCDVYLVSCGCYGIPLCNEIKKAGKKAIYVGGILQLLFGLKGSRWTDRPVINKYFNKYWITPSSKPKNWESIENGCYW